MERPTYFLRTGAVLGERYWIACLLGGDGGGRRQVYLACDLAGGNCPVAIKVAREDLRHEGLLLSILSHPRIPRPRELFLCEGCWCLVMDWFEGTCLDDSLRGAGGGRLPPVQVLTLAVQLCDVLVYLHERRYPIVHCDLKPSNILLAEDGQVILLDFGIARFAMSAPPLLTPTHIARTPGYAAPEYARLGFVTVRADIYSLGVVLNQLLTGSPPRGGCPRPSGEAGIPWESCFAR